MACLTYAERISAALVLSCVYSNQTINGEPMSWHVVTQKNGKTALIDLSKVMYILEADEGWSIHFQTETENASGKRTPKTLDVRGSVTELSKILMGRKFLRTAQA
jgi:hypothetical protein